MAVSNITNVEFGNLTMVETEPHYQYDYGQKLKFTDLNLPSSYEVHFANDATTGIAYTQLGDSTGVTIPNALFRTGKPIFAFIYLHKGSDDGKTVYVVKIPVRSRAKPSDMVVPSDEETSIIRDAIAALQAATEAVEITEEEVAEMVSDKVEEMFNDPDIGEKIGALSIGDGTLERKKVDADFEATLQKADNSWQKSERETIPFTTGSWESIYDPEGQGKINGIDPYTYASNKEDEAIKRLRGVNNIQSGNQTFDITDSQNTTHTYTGIDNALSGLYTLGNEEIQRILNNYKSFNIVIKTEQEMEELLQGEGEEYTFYLVPDGDNYIKYWYINTGNDNYTWDIWGSTGASSTIVVNELPVVGDPNVDYILSSNDTYQYYKYINNDWHLIAGNNSEIISYPSGMNNSIIYFGEGAPENKMYGDKPFYLDTSTMTLYSLEIVSDPQSGEQTYRYIDPTLLVTNPNENKDYYILDDSNDWRHYRYLVNVFKQIGNNGYSKNEVDTMINGLSTTVNDMGSTVEDLSNDFENLNTNVTTRMSAQDSAISIVDSKISAIGNMVSDVTSSDTGIIVHYRDGSTNPVPTKDATVVVEDVVRSDDGITVNYTDGTSDNIEISGGGGGGGDVGGTVSIGRITPATAQNIYGDPCAIEYTVTATDSSGESVGDGVGTLYVNGVSVESGFTVYTSDSGANNSIQIGEYLIVGVNTVKISVSVDTGGESRKVATKTWTINSVNMYLTWNYADSQINTSAVTDYFTPFGALTKTIYTFIDVNPIGFNPEIVTALPDQASPDFNEDEIKGINYFVNNNNIYTHYIWDTVRHDFVTAEGRVIDVTTTTRSGVQQAVVIPVQSHGSHAIVRFMVGVINGETIKIFPQMHDMVFVDVENETPIIATSFNTASMVQYNTVQIPIVVYDPSNPTTTVTLKEDGTIVSTWTNVDRTTHYWNYSPTTYGTKILTIECGETIKTIQIQVEELDIDEAEVTGYDFRFKASEMATNDSVRAWSSTYTPVGSNNPRTVNITFSPNFDWVNGGLHTETDENGHLRQYLAIRAGTTATFNYNLFGQDYDPKQYGKAFKFIFKAVNCRTYDGEVLTCMDTSNGNNGVGLIMNANEATLTTANNNLKTYYYKDSYTEFEVNIHPNSEYRYLQFWMDGSPDITKLYDTSDGMQQVTPVGITVGSPNCDVYVYMIKAYPTYLTNDNELSNFIMDAPNAYEMVDRYNRNDILNASGEIDYQKLANVNPDMRVVCLDLNRMSTGKKDNVVAYTVRYIYNSGGESRSFTVPNACVTIQGTSSVGYLESAGNVDINFKNGRTFTSDNVSYTTGAITFDDGSTSTKGYSLNDNSIPVDYLNVKVNVASSENCNNACNADWYNTYQPWLSPARAKNSKARDTMEFVAGAIFIRDRSGNLFGDTNNYHFYGICDIGNSKKNTKVFHDTTNPIAVCMEVSNNTSLPCLMSSDDYEWNADDDAVTQEIVDGELKEQKVYEFRYVEDGMEKVGEANWDRFAKFMVCWNPNLATNANLSSPVTFGTYTFKGSGSYDTSSYDNDNYKVVYLYGYGLPTEYNNGLYSATDYISDTSGTNTCYYYINYSNDYIYSSNGSTWTAIEELTWTPDRNSVLGGVNVGTYAGTYTKDSFEYRMAYMLAHCEEYMVIDPVIYHFIFIESFLMTDNVAKNTFWSTDDGVHWELSKDYDNDTSLGNDNVGGLSFTYGLETDDTVGASYVFNAHDASWITFARNLFVADQVMYRNRESAGCFNSTNYLAKAKQYQSVRPERVWVADAQRKYLRPYEDNGTETYLPMLAGKKTHQREQVKTYNAYYYASKYVSDFCTSQNIMVRGNTPTVWHGVRPANTATLSMYIDCYIIVASTSYNVVAKTRAKRGQTYVMDFSTIGSMGETELYFCTAPMITELSGLAHLYFKQNNFAMGTNLQRLEIGSNVAGYENPNLESLTIGNNKMLEYLDVRNCPNVSGALDLSGCISLRELYLENTNFTGISIAKGGLLETAHLDSPTSISMMELIYVNDLKLESTNNLTTLRVENCIFAPTAILTIDSTVTTQAEKDIVLNLIDSSNNLSRVRLVGVNWVLSDTDVLDRALGFAGIDDDSFDIQQSVLTGEAYVPIIKSSMLEKYNNIWKYLMITYDTVIAQYTANFMNADGEPIKDRKGNNYIQYVDSGEPPYDPVTMGRSITISDDGIPDNTKYPPATYNNKYYLDKANGIVYLSNGTNWVYEVQCDILTPSMQSTGQYDYTYDGWDDITSIVIFDKTITAKYIKTLKTYRVRWFRERNYLLEEQTGIPYGTEVSYSGDTLPTWTDGEATSQYRLFKGWDRSTGYITGDTDVFAIWDYSLLPPLNTPMHEMTLAQIYGVARSDKQEEYGWEDLDYFDVTLGKDFDFSQRDNITPRSNGRIDHIEIGKDVLLPGIEKDTFISGGYYFDGTKAVTTDIKLFDKDSPSFTMAIDFQFSNTLNTTLLSCNLDSSTSLLRLYNNGTNVMLDWGGVTTPVGYTTCRDIVVMRHQKGSSRLTIYNAGGANRYQYSPTVARSVKTRETDLPVSSIPLTFGGINVNGAHRNYAKGHIHWCKIWFEDLGDKNAIELASWVHEKVRFEYWRKNNYYYYGTNELCKASFISNNLLGYFNTRGSYWYSNPNKTATNVGGWRDSYIKQFCDERIYNGMPTELQALIHNVEVKSSAGDRSMAILTTNSKIYFPSYKEMENTTTAPYVDEVGETSTPISWFTNNPQRIKFRGHIRAYKGDTNYTIYDNTIEGYDNRLEPSTVFGGTINIKPGDIWINAANGSVGYMFISGEEIDHYGITSSIIEPDREYVPSGAWVPSSTYWLRSPYINSDNGAGGINTPGYITWWNTNNNIGLVLCVSI